MDVVIKNIQGHLLQVKTNIDGFYDEVDIIDMQFNDANETFTFMCPCGDKFSITMKELQEGYDIAHCPSCSLILKVIYTADDLKFS